MQRRPPSKSSRLSARRLRHTPMRPRTRRISAPNCSPSKIRHFDRLLAVYEHVAGVLGAITLIGFIGHLIVFDWHGTIHQLLDVWLAFIRPLVEFLLTRLVSYPLHWCFGWHFVIPPIFRDYIAVGLMFSLSQIRSERAWWMLPHFSMLYLAVTWASVLNYARVWY